MSWGYYGWKPYVPVAKRRANAARALAKLEKKTDQAASPVVIPGRQIANTFWGKAWCNNLESYSDFANRLPRGRTYVRNGSVVDLQVSPGKVTARVCGSELYRINIKIKPLTPSLWKTIQTECAGKIDSLLELLQGKLSSGVMQIVTRRERGLFPAPHEIDLGCSCPDWADLCKHAAAALYGVGARLDTNPELLFLLRGVNAADLISQASAAEAVRQTAAPAGTPAMSEAEVADVFGIELAPASAPAAPAEPTPPPVPPVVSETPAPTPSKPRTRRAKKPKAKVSPQARARLVTAVKARWARMSTALAQAPAE